MSRPRNPLIAEVFFRRGLIERWGRGTQKIVELCVAAGQPEPEFEEQAGSVVVRFRPSSYVPPLRVSHDLDDRQREILHLLSDHQKWKADDILKRMAVPPPKRTLQADLSLLRQFGLVESSGRGPSAGWRLKPPQSTEEDAPSGEKRREASQRSAGEERREAQHRERRERRESAEERRRAGRERREAQRSAEKRRGAQRSAER